MEGYDGINHGRMPLRSYYIHRCRPNIMNRPIINLLEIVNRGSFPYAHVRNSAEELADSLGYMLIEKPYNAHTCESWRELDLLSIKKAVVVVMPPENYDIELMYRPAVELWLKAGEEWVVSVTNFGGDE